MAVVLYVRGYKNAGFFNSFPQLYEGLFYIRISYSIIVNLRQLFLTVFTAFASAPVSFSKEMRYKSATCLAGRQAPVKPGSALKLVTKKLKLEYESF
ncbi:MAG: hypothetical protein U0V75_06570 [Ferruginibacter sp.]